jgi:hypothetical protein
MKIPHSRYHWIAVALAVAVLLLTLNVAHGQSTGASAVFEGRPAMSGAQGGLGAQAGPPQGGIGLQGSDTRPGVAGTAPATAGATPAAAAPSAGNMNLPAPTDTAAKDVKPGRDQSLAKDQRSVKKAKRAAKRTISRSRHGVSEIDSGVR